MSIYFLIRYGLLSGLLVGWIVYQLLCKKKKLGELQGDINGVLLYWCVDGAVLFDAGVRKINNQYTQKPEAQKKLYIFEKLKKQPFINKSYTTSQPAVPLL